MVIDELAAVGDVELFALLHPRRTDPLTAPDPALVRRWTTAVTPLADLRVRQRPHWLRSGLPMEMAAQDFGPLRRSLRAWAAARYDLVWVSKVTTWVALGGPRLGPAVLDLDDLEDRKIRSALSADAMSADRGGRSTAHFVAATAQARLNARRWERIQRAAATGCRAVALCSALDIDRAGLANAAVVANGYPVPTIALGGRPVGDPPTVLLPGLLTYPPNADAARWLARDIAPRLRALTRGARVRLVGTAHPPVESLHDPPRVEVVGWVHDMDEELRRADLVAVPLRSGSGTRVKILEAFAHRIPVVSTTLGAEGLDAEHDKHLLLADDADAFAAACARVLRDEGLRRRMTRAAHALYLHSHTSAVTRSGVRAIVDPLLRSGS